MNITQKPHDMTQPTNHHNLYQFPNFIQQTNPNHKPQLTLIQSIIDQNQILKNQLQNLQSQLKKSKNISQNLLTQNISLRSLDKERTYDISKLLNTITINTNQMLMDYQHQSFLMTQLNCIVLKQIKLISQQIQLTTNNIKIRNQQLSQLNTSKTILEQQTINKLKIKLQTNLNITKLKQNKKKQFLQIDKINQLNSIITELYINNNKINNQIRLINKELQEYNDFQQKKEELENRLYYINIENKKYINQINNDNNNFQRIISDLLAKKEKLENIKKELTIQISKYQKYQRSNQQFLIQKDNIKEEIIKNKNITTTAMTTLEQTKEEKEKLKEKIKKMKEKFIQLQQNHHRQEENRQKNTQMMISGMVKSMREAQREAEIEINRIISDRENIMEEIERQSSEAGSLYQSNQSQTQSIKFKEQSSSIASEELIDQLLIFQ